jgi:hypothetical protein
MHVHIHTRIPLQVDASGKPLDFKAQLGFLVGAAGPGPMIKKAEEVAAVPDEPIALTHAGKSRPKRAAARKPGGGGGNKPIKPPAVSTDDFLDLGDEMVVQPLHVDSPPEEEEGTPPAPNKPPPQLLVDDSAASPPPPKKAPPQLPVVEGDGTPPPPKKTPPQLPAAAMEDNDDSEESPSAKSQTKKKPKKRPAEQGSVVVVLDLAGLETAQATSPRESKSPRGDVPPSRVPPVLGPSAVLSCLVVACLAVWLSCASVSETDCLSI